MKKGKKKKIPLPGFEPARYTLSNYETSRLDHCAMGANRYSIGINNT